MTAVPADRPVTILIGAFTVATAVLSLLQLPPLKPGDSADDDPTQAVVVPVIVATGLTVVTFVATQLPTE
jgi:hypothetical protein